MNNTKGGKKKQTPLQMNLKSIKKSNHVFKRYAVDCNSVLQPVRLVRSRLGMEKQGSARCPSRRALLQ